MHNPQYKKYPFAYELQSLVSFPMLLRDSAPEKNNIILERYMSDVYSMFLNKLSLFIMGQGNTEKDKEKMRALLGEVIKIKTLLDDKGEN